MDMRLGTPVTLRNLTLKNRIVFAPTSMGLKKEEYLEKIGRIAGGGTALLVIGDVPVERRSLFAPTLYSQKGFSYYREVTERIHGEGALACAQLHRSDSDLKGMLKYIPAVMMKKISADDLRRLLNEQIGSYISSISEERVKEITSSFSLAARLAQEAGFDMIQVHGDRMCGSFSSSVFNSRTDSYGGSAENRARFAVEAVRAVRTAAPEIPLEYKLAVRQESPHYGNAGILEEELAVFVPLLERAGVDCFHVALADHSSLSDTIPPKEHPYYGKPGCFLKYCDEVKKLTNLPVCGVGGLTRPEFVEEQLVSGRIDYAALSRPLIADPEWVNKALTGREKEIKICVRCNRECLGGMQAHRGVHCIYDKSREENAG